MASMGCSRATWGAPGAQNGPKRSWKPNQHLPAILCGLVSSFIIWAQAAVAMSCGHELGEHHLLKGQMEADGVEETQKMVHNNKETKETQAEKQKKPFAYVSMLFGSQPYLILHGLALGLSIRRCSPPGSDIDMVLLVTADVTQWAQKILGTFWQIKSMPDIDIKQIDRQFFNADFFHEASRFEADARMFMKLHLFDPDLLPYRKVLFLDVDTIVRDRIADGIWDLPTPSACPAPHKYDRHNRQILNNEVYKEGMPMPEDLTFNAGVMLVEPDGTEHKEMLADICKKRSWHQPSTYPSSWFLKKWFTYPHHIFKCWHALGPDMNLSPRLTKGQPLTDAFLHLEFMQITVIHYMGCAKPHLWWAHGSIEPFPGNWKTRITLPKGYNDKTWKAMEKRGEDCLRVYVKYAAQGIVLSAIANGWTAKGCHTPADMLHNAMLHIVPKRKSGSIPGELYKVFRQVFSLFVRIIWHQCCQHLVRSSS